MPTVRGDWSKWITPGARKAFTQEYPELPAQYPNLFNVLPSARAFEDVLVSAGLGTVPEKPEAEDVALDRPYPRGSVRATHRGFGLGFEVSREMVEDDLYGVIVPKAGRYLARAQRDAEERLAAQIFNLAFTTQQGYDGVSLINQAHVRIGVADDANGPSDNADISLDSLQEMIEHFLTLEDDRGLKLQIMANSLIHHPANYWIVREILSAEFKPFTANNERNIVRDDFSIQPVTYNFLTDTDSWFALIKGHEMGPTFYWRRKPDDDTDFDKRAQVTIYLTTSRMSAVCPDWRPLYGSTGS